MTKNKTLSYTGVTNEFIPSFNTFTVSNYKTYQTLLATCGPQTIRRRRVSIPASCLAASTDSCTPTHPNTLLYT